MAPAAHLFCLIDIIEDESGTGNLGVTAGNQQANPSLYNLQNYRILQGNKAGTNWWSALFRPALTQNHNLTLSGAYGGE